MRLDEYSSGFEGVMLTQGGFLLTRQYPDCVIHIMIHEAQLCEWVVESEPEPHSALTWMPCVRQGHWSRSGVTGHVMRAASMRSSRACLTGCRPAPTPCNAFGAHTHMLAALSCSNCVFAVHFCSLCAESRQKVMSHV